MPLSSKTCSAAVHGVYTGAYTAGTHTALLVLGRLRRGNGFEFKANLCMVRPYPTPRVCSVGRAPEKISSFLEMPQL